MTALTDEEVVQIADDAARHNMLGNSTLRTACIIGARAVAAKLSGGAGEPVTRTDILREWYGGERYARDYEYLDANFGHLAQRVVDYLRATPPAEPAVVPALDQHPRHSSPVVSHDGASGDTQEPAPAADDLVERLNTAYDRYQTVLALHAAARITDLQAEVGRKDAGWLYHNEDTGIEWSEQHPVESGEVPDATNILPGTAENLLRALKVEWDENRSKDTVIQEDGETIAGLMTKLEQRGAALVEARSTIIELKNARWSECEGTDADWVGFIDAALNAGERDAQG